MSFLDSNLFDQKLNKYHEIIEHEKTESSKFITTPRSKTNTQYISNQGMSSDFSTYFPKRNRNNSVIQSSEMAPYSKSNGSHFYSPRSRRQTSSFMMNDRTRSKSPNSFSFHDNDSSEDLIKKSIQVITKIERHTRSSSSSRAQSPSSLRSTKDSSANGSPFVPKNAENTSLDHDEDRDIEISDLENSPKSSSRPSNSNSPSKGTNFKSNKEYMDIRDSTSPLKALKRGLSSIFISQFHKKNDRSKDNKYESMNIRTINNTSPRSRSLTNPNISSFTSPTLSKFEQSNWIKVPNRHSPNFIISDGSNNSPTQKYLSSRSSSPSRSQASFKYSSKASNYDANQNSNSTYRFSSTRNKSPTSPTYANKNFNRYSNQTTNLVASRNYLDSGSSDEEVFSINTNTSNNFTTSYQTKPNFSIKSPIKYNTRYNDDIVSNTFSSGSQRNNFSRSSTTNSQYKIIQSINDDLSSTDTESNYNFNQNENDDFIKSIPKAETKLTKKFSKQISSLFSPENQRRKGYLIISDSDSSSSSNFHPKPPPVSITNRSFNFNNDNNYDRTKNNLLQTKFTEQILSSDSDSSIFEINRNYRQTSSTITTTTFNNVDLSSSSDIEPIMTPKYDRSNTSSFINQASNINSKSPSYSLKTKRNLGTSRFSTERNNEIEFVTGSPRIIKQTNKNYRSKLPVYNFNIDSDSEDEFFEALKDTIKANESVLNSIGC